jgi:hypothetical protein
MIRRRTVLLAVFVFSLGHACVTSLLAQPPANLYSPPPRAITSDSRYVGATVFHWFVANSGQNSGPWRPTEGRTAWTGEPDFWQEQIKQIMSANIDVMYVHLIRHAEVQRVNLFRALSQMRAQGYDVPKIAPFLDPLIIWDGKPMVDLATLAGNDEFVGEYIRFFKQYYSANTDPHADDYLAKMNGKVQLDTWHIHLNTANRKALTRDDVERRLVAVFGKAHPVFKNGIHMVTTKISPTFTFADEKLAQFEVNEYLVESKSGDYESAQIKAGYWDQNVRNPGSIMLRDGGRHYVDAWAKANANRALRHINVESWNEYDEGTGIFRASTGAPYIHPGSGNKATDTWSNSKDPLEYITTTAAGARTFNDVPDRAAHVLWHNLPKRMRAGEEADYQVIVRNDGDLSWTTAQNFRLGQQEFAKDETLFGVGRFTFADAENEVPKYGGVFRGRPVTFHVHLSAPAKAGKHVTHWSMVQENVAWFGDVLTVPIEVVADGT